MPTHVIRAAGYRRVSSAEQVEGHSLDAQANNIQTYITAHDWQLIEIYADQGLSAKKGSARPELERLMADAAKGCFDVVVVDKIDRFYRHLGSLLVALDRLNECGVTFVSVQERLDFTSPWGKLTLTVLGMLAEIYIDNLRQETRKGKLQRARSGLWNGNIPYGYCNGRCSHCTDINGPGYCPEVGQPDKATGQQLILHPMDSVAVRLAYEWYLTGECTHPQIADRLNAYEIILPDGTRRHFRTKGISGRYAPGPINKSTLREVLRRRFYAGEIVYRGAGKAKRTFEAIEIFKGQHPAIITPEQFEKVQELRDVFWRSPRYQYNAPSTIYPLAGLLRCGWCGAAMRAVSHQGRRYYRDATRIEHRGACPQHNLHAEPIEAQVCEWAKQLAQAMQVAQADLNSTDQAQFQLKVQAQQRFERAKELYLMGELERETYESERHIYHSQIGDLRDRELDAMIALQGVISESVKSLTEALPTEKRKLLRLMFGAIFVRDNQLLAVQLTPAFYKLILPVLELDGDCSCGPDECRILLGQPRFRTFCPLPLHYQELCRY